MTSLSDSLFPKSLSWKEGRTYKRNSLSYITDSHSLGLTVTYFLCANSPAAPDDRDSLLDAAVLWLGATRWLTDRRTADAQLTHSRLHQAVRQRPPGYSACGQRHLISGDMLARDTVLKEDSTWSNPNLYFCCFQILTTIKGRCVSTHCVCVRETDRRTGNEREYENKMDKEPGQMWRQISSFKIHADTDTDSYTYKLS